MDTLSLRICNPQFPAWQEIYWCVVILNEREGARVRRLVFSRFFTTFRMTK